MTSIEVAEYLGLTEGRVRQLTREGLLKGTKVGRDWVYTRADVDEFRDSPRPRPGRPAKDNNG